MRRLTRLGTTAILATGLCAGAVAAPDVLVAPAMAKTVRAKLDIPALRKQLNSGKPAQINAALSTIADAGARARPLLVDLNGLLGAGVGLAQLPKLIKVTAELKDASSSKVIAPYVRHRSKPVRRAAAAGLSRTGGKAAVAGLRKGLRSRDAAVRGISASGLGTLGAKEALPDLFKAFDRNVGEAAAAIGQLCSKKQCEKFLGSLGKTPFDIMSSGIDEILFRKPAEVSDEEKIAVVVRLRELGTKDVGKYLSKVSSRWPKESSKKVKKAIDDAVAAVGGASSDEE